MSGSCSAPGTFHRGLYSGLSMSGALHGPVSVSFQLSGCWASGSGISLGAGYTASAQTTVSASATAVERRMARAV